MAVVIVTNARNELPNSRSSTVRSACFLWGCSALILLLCGTSLWSSICTNRNYPTQILGSNSRIEKDEEDLTKFIVKSKLSEGPEVDPQRPTRGKWDQTAFGRENSENSLSLSTMSKEGLADGEEKVTRKEGLSEGEEKFPRNEGLDDGEEKFIWYAPTSGFSNQARELTNALKMAMVLNRTLIVPPVLDHFEIEAGTCLVPLHAPRQIRKLAWDAISTRVASSRYLSIADVIDLAQLKSFVKTIDFRAFLAMWCGIDIAPACTGPTCHSFAHQLQPWGSLSTCATQLFQPSINSPNSRSSSHFVHDIDDDCNTTVWTHGESQSHRSSLDQRPTNMFHNDSQLQLEVNVSSLHIMRRDIMDTLGPSSEVGKAFLLAFGTLFSRHYQDMILLVDIKAKLGDKHMEENLRKIEHRPFTLDIVEAARHFVEETIIEPFFCTHVRLDDGAFKFNEENAIFSPLQQELEHLVMTSTNSHHETSSKTKVNLFLMTDLPPERWHGTYLHDLDMDPHFKIHTLYGKDDLFMNVTKRIALREFGFTSQSKIPHLHYRRVGSTEGTETMKRRSNRGVHDPRLQASFRPPLHNLIFDFL